MTKEAGTTKPAQLADFPVVVTVPIQWGDQDAIGHVNNTRCFLWYETARVRYLEKCDLPTNAHGGAVAPILAAISCNYKLQLNYPDTVHIGARISRIRRSSITMDYAVYSESLDAIAADGDSTVVVFDYESNRPVRVPEEIRDVIRKLEDKPDL